MTQKQREMLVKFAQSPEWHVAVKPGIESIILQQSVRGGDMAEAKALLAVIDFIDGYGTTTPDPDGPWDIGPTP